MRRLFTAIALVVMALYLVWKAPSTLFIAATALTGILCYWEYSGIAAAHGVRRPGIIGILAGLALLLLSPEYALVAVAILLLIAFGLSLRLNDLRESLPQLACTFFGALYTFLPWRFAVQLRQFGVPLLFFALALNWVGDTAAYYVGKTFGRHKLAPIASPGKTWEGSIASLLFSILFGVFYLGKTEPTLPLALVAAMAFAGNLAGQIGDLSESAIKRGAGLKDSSGLLPGHGGLLDRLDSSLFALPAVYAIFLINRYGLFR